jgi:mutator family transposase
LGRTRPSRPTSIAAKRETPSSGLWASSFTHSTSISRLNVQSNNRNDLKTRGVADILIAAVDGLKGFPEAIGAVFPETVVQTCIAHLIRNSMAFVSWKDRKAIMPDLEAKAQLYQSVSFVAELRGFEPMAIAGATRSRAGSPVGFARPLKAALGGVFAFLPGRRLEPLAIPQGHGDAVAEGVEEVVFTLLPLAPMRKLSTWSSRWLRE